MKETIEKINKELNLNLDVTHSLQYMIETFDEKYKDNRCETLLDAETLYYKFQNFCIKFTTEGYYEGFDISIIDLKDMNNVVKEKLKEVSKEIETLNYKMLELIKIFSET